MSRYWSIDLRDNPTGGTEVFFLGNFNYVGEMTRGSGVIRDIDFCYTEVPNDLVSTYRNGTPRGITDERARHVFRIDFISTPDPKEIFAFSGQIKPEMHADLALVTEMNVYPGLRYLRTESEFHVFELPVPHLGHDNFKGCSGAPIVDRTKTVVALVCDGDQSTNTIRGVSLARYKFAFDFV